MQAGTAVGNLAGVIGVRPDEAAVVEQLKAGSEEAFAWLISRYQQPLYSLIYRILPNPGDAADITQEVFVKVFRGIGHFHFNHGLPPDRLPSPARPWRVRHNFPPPAHDHASAR